MGVARAGQFESAADCGGRPGGSSLGEPGVRSRDAEEGTDHVMCPHSEFLLQWQEDVRQFLEGTIEHLLVGRWVVSH